MKWLSIVILTYNEEKNIRKIIDNIFSLEQLGDAEIIVSDGFSSDRTRDLIEENCIQVLVSEPNRSTQMNEAVKIAKGKFIWFLHSDMELPLDALVHIRGAITNGYNGGGFANIFDKHNDKIKRLGTILNLRFFDKKEQSDRGVFYGDNAIFIAKNVLLDIGGVPQQDLMEDYELSIRLKNNGVRMFKVKDAPIIVSSRRHVAEGFIKTRLRWIIIRKLYQWGIDASKLKQIYSDNR